MQTYKKEYFSDEVKEVVETTKKEFKTRYDSKVRLRLEDNKIVIRNLKSPDLKANQSERDIIHTVTLDEDQRPDLIANNQSSILYEKNTIYNHRALQHIVGRSAE